MQSSNRRQKMGTSEASDVMVRTDQARDAGKWASNSGNSWANTRFAGCLDAFWAKRGPKGQE